MNRRTFVQTAGATGLGLAGRLGMADTGGSIPTLLKMLEESPRERVRGELVRMGWQHVKDDRITVRQPKTGATLAIRIHPELARALAAAPKDNLTFLVTERGASFTAGGFGNWFRDRCNDAGLPNCTAHGLKKAGATIAAENGATTRQLMAMFDWDTPSMAEVYTRAAEKSGSPANPCS